MQTMYLIFKLQDEICFEQIVSLIFHFDLDIEVAEFIKLLRRYRFSIIEIKCTSKREFLVGFSFQNLELLNRFKEDYLRALNEELT